MHGIPDMISADPVGVFLSECLRWSRIIDLKERCENRPVYILHGEAAVRQTSA